MNFFMVLGCYEYINSKAVKFFKIFIDIMYVLAVWTIAFLLEIKYPYLVCGDKFKKKLGNMECVTISAEDFVSAAREFLNISQRINDGWRIFEDSVIHKCYLKKETYINYETEKENILCKAEYIIFYNLSYGVPSFSFNIWNSTGSLLTLEKIRRMSLFSVDEAQFYSMITQQDHPLFQRPYFIVHPCHTEALLQAFRNRSKNIIVTFLGLVTPLLKIDLPYEYGL